MMKIARRFESMFFGPSRWIGGLGMSTVILLMIFTVGESLLRNIFNYAIAGTHELVEFTMAVLVFFALAYTQIEKRHVSIDLLYNKLSPTVQRILESLTSLASLGIFILMTWQTILYGLEMRENHTVSPTLNIPLYPILFIIAFGIGLLCLVLAANFVNSLDKGREK
jgi:TRAP-type C4-dicarboxylate transport system permease small subunit